MSDIPNTDDIRIALIAAALETAKHIPAPGHNHEAIRQRMIENFQTTLKAFFETYNEIVEEAAK